MRPAGAFLADEIVFWGRQAPFLADKIVFWVRNASRRGFLGGYNFILGLEMRPAGGFWADKIRRPFVAF